MFLADVSSSTSVVNNIFVSTAALLAVIGAVIGVFSWQRKSGAKDAQDDRVANIVLGEGNKPDLGQRVDTMTAKLDIVYANMLPNGGKSMRDDVAQTRHEMGAMNNTLQQLVGKVEILCEKDR